MFILKTRQLLVTLVLLFCILKQCIWCTGVIKIENFRISLLHHSILKTIVTIRLNLKVWNQNILNILPDSCHWIIIAHRNRFKLIYKIVPFIVYFLTAIFDYFHLMAFLFIISTDSFWICIWNITAIINWLIFSIFFTFTHNIWVIFLACRLTHIVWFDEVFEK